MPNKHNNEAASKSLILQFGTVSRVIHTKTAGEQAHVHVGR